MFTRDELVDAVTACGTFAELERSMRDDGYCPTLYGRMPAGLSRVRVKQQMRWNRKVNLLRAEVVKAGYRYFDGRRVVGTEPAE